MRGTTKDKDPLVSVVTPTFDHGRFIRQCIESVLCQRYSNWEQIVIDDGSTDDTGEIVRGYRDPRIRYERQSNQGPFELANTYNRALSVAKGDLIAILEGDDFWPPEKLANIVAGFRDHPEAVLAYGEAADVDAHGKMQRRESRTTRLRQRLPEAVLQNHPIGSATLYMLLAEGRSLVSPSTVVLRRSILNQIGGFQHVAGLPLIDYPTFLEFSLQGRFLYYPEIMGYRRRHERSITANHARAIHEKVCEYTLRFMELHSEQVVLGAAERNIIEESWRRANDKLNFAEGRMSLLNRRWSEARQHFTAVCRSSNLTMRFVGLAGLISSCLHVDIEFLVQLAGSAGLRTSH